MCVPRNILTHVPRTHAPATPHAQTHSLPHNAVMAHGSSERHPSTCTHLAAIADTAGMATAEKNPKAARVAATAARGACVANEGAAAVAASERDQSSKPHSRTLRTDACAHLAVWHLHQMTGSSKSVRVGCMHVEAARTGHQEGCGWSVERWLVVRCMCLWCALVACFGRQHSVGL